MTDQKMDERPSKGPGMHNGKFWLLIVVMVAVIAVGGIFMS
jgi:hypothetical protein